MNTLHRDLTNWVRLTELALERMKGDTYTARLLADMVAEISGHVDSIDFGDELVKYRGVTLLCLGPVPYSRAIVGSIEVSRAAYIGSNGKIYIEGPRRRYGRTVIDIHPYCKDDAQGWSGVSATVLATMTAACFI